MDTKAGKSDITIYITRILQPSTLFVREKVSIRSSCDTVSGVGIQDGTSTLRFQPSITEQCHTRSRLINAIRQSLVCGRCIRMYWGRGTEIERRNTGRGKREIMQQVCGHSRECGYGVGEWSKFGRRGCRRGRRGFPIA